MKNILVAFMVTFGLTNNSAHGIVVLNKTINHIHEILEYLPLEDPLLPNSMIGVFDWDQTVSNKDGQNEPREKGDNGTLNTINQIHNFGINTCILTARLNGFGLHGGILNEKEYTGAKIRMIVDDNVNRILQILGQDWLNHGALIDNNLKDEKVPTSSSESQSESSSSDSDIFFFNQDLERTLYYIQKDQIIFAGGNPVKGKVLAHLIDRGEFKGTLESLFFVDDGKYNIKEVARIFEDRPEKVYLFHYPM